MLTTYAVYFGPVEAQNIIVEADSEDEAARLAKAIWRSRNLYPAIKEIREAVELGELEEVV